MFLKKNLITDGKTFHPELLDANAEAKPRKVASVQTSELDVTLSEKLDKMLEMQN